MTPYVTDLEKRPYTYLDRSTGELVNLTLSRVLEYNPARIAAYLLHQVDQEERGDLGEPGDAGHGYIVVRQSCGKRRVIPELCSDPLCESCGRLKAYRDRRRWEPVVKAMRDPRMITLTIKDGPCLAERIEFFQAAFRRFLSLRLGPRNLKALRAAALDYAGDQVERWRCSIDRFTDAVQKRREKRGKWPEMRHMIGRGFARLEITWLTDWHVHRHLCVDGAFIPWPFLCAAWLRATRGEAQITDIRRVDQSPEGMAEVVKYITKPWEIPGELQQEFKTALWGMKRIWPLGGAKPAEDKSECPYCHDPNCKAGPAGLCNLVESGELWGRAYKVFEMDSLSDINRTRFVMLRDNDGLWREAPLLDTLSVCVAVGHPERGSPGAGPGPGSPGSVG